METIFKMQQPTYVYLLLFSTNGGRVPCYRIRRARAQVKCQQGKVDGGLGGN